MKSKLTAVALTVLAGLPALASASPTVRQGQWADYGQASLSAPANTGSLPSALAARAPLRQGESADYGQAPRVATPSSVASPVFGSPVAAGDAANYPASARTAPTQRASQADPAV